MKTVNSKEVMMMVKWVLPAVAAGVVGCVAYLGVGVKTGVDALVEFYASPGGGGDNR